MKLSQDVIQTAIEQTNSMKQAAESLNVPFGTFKYHAVQYGLYVPNQSGKGNKYPNRGEATRYDLDLILNGTIEYKAPSQMLKRRLLEAGIKKDECECCGQLPMWNNRPLVLQLDHIDGNHRNNKLDNLRIICPNCHTQTDTFASQNKNVYNWTPIDQITIDTLLNMTWTSLSDLLKQLNLNHKNETTRKKIQLLVDQLQ